MDRMLHSLNRIFSNNVSTPTGTRIPLSDLLIRHLIAGIGLLLLCSIAMAGNNAVHDDSDSLPAISIIIDDIGYTYDRDQRAILLPGAVSYAILPHTPYAVHFANLAYQFHKDVLLHQPMQPVQASEEEHLGPGALTMDMDRDTFLRVLRDNINSIPHVVGINNHMGSLLTQHPGDMGWLMQAISKRNDLFFIDSFTTNTSVAQQIANENWVLNMRRDVFLDNQRDARHIRIQLARLLHTADKNGLASLSRNPASAGTGASHAQKKGVSFGSHF
jgi:polysaccharide deacetylase 2 family uncharacterized protein YibQ